MTASQTAPDPVRAREAARGLGAGKAVAARREGYRAEYPHDPWFRDFDAWAAAEWRAPELFAGMYRYWRRKPGA